MRKSLEPIGGIAREARIARGISQATLARRIGCHQPQISWLEAGRPGALAKDKIVALTQVLGIDLGSIPTPGDATLRYCPNVACPTNAPHLIGQDIVLRPTFVHATSSKPTWCRVCGDVLETSCPDSDCGAPIEHGMFCVCCGHRYVPVPHTLSAHEPNIEEYFAARRAHSTEILDALSGSPGRKSTPGARP